MCVISREEKAWRQEARGRKRAGAGAETQSQQVINKLEAVQQERGIIRLYVCSGKLVLAAMYLQ
jgi:serine phosphatase RsbU (regulator of sigma subunit)